MHKRPQVRLPTPSRHALENCKNGNGSFVRPRLGRYWTITSAYAPQPGCSKQDKDDFYLSLEEAIRSVPEGDYLSMAADMNGHVGSGRRGVERVHGGKGIGLINPDGERILDLAISHDLAICSTFFAKRESQKVTYASGGRSTEVDDILVRRPALKTVRDVKVIPGEDVSQKTRTEPWTLKGKLYRTVVRFAILYGSECWALGYLVGDSPTWADLYLAEFAELANKVPSLYDGFPEVKEHSEKVRSIPTLKKWLGTRPQTSL
ncbi:unnamed protein product [Heligmosomoides polygyrus]|uniref:GST C-terminal domain-containing protein n=1 Tax=Heligmosomoides polygyrus TaxID=6339 RepID=A0A3P8CU86_HELPZ|nr:unnamed protein product [Heligmosomoides polygyrus]